jgi:hypothetical protein
MITSVPKENLKATDTVIYSGHSGPIHQLIPPMLRCRECGFTHQISFRISTVTVERKP